MSIQSTSVSGQMTDTGVLIPAYNAENTLPALIAKLVQYVPAQNVLVVNDGSTDNTAAVARAAGVQVISTEVNRGKGSALSKGFEVLKSDGRFGNVITMDADLQHPADRIPDLIQAKSRTGADIVIGRRRRQGSKMPIHRILSNSITSFLVSARTGRKIPDSQCGFRLIGMDVLAEITVNSAGFEAETEFLIRAVRKGFTVEFVPVETIYDGEKSHMQNWKTTVNFIKVLLKDY